MLAAEVVQQNTGQATSFGTATGCGSLPNTKAVNDRSSNAVS